MVWESVWDRPTYIVLLSVTATYTTEKCEIHAHKTGVLVPREYEPCVDRHRQSKKNPCQEYDIHPWTRSLNIPARVRKNISFIIIDIQSEAIAVNYCKSTFLCASVTQVPVSYIILHKLQCKYHDLSRGLFWQSHVIHKMLFYLQIIVNLSYSKKNVLVLSPGYVENQQNRGEDHAQQYNCSYNNQFTNWNRRHFQEVAAWWRKRAYSEHSTI